MIMDHCQCTCGAGAAPRATCNRLTQLGKRRFGSGLARLTLVLALAGTSVAVRAQSRVERDSDCDAANLLELRFDQPQDACVRPGQTVHVALSQECLSVLMRGYQAFLEFELGRLDFAGGMYVLPLPYGLPIISPISAVGPTIDLAAGIDDAGGQTPTLATADLVILTFTAGTTEGSTLVVFRPHDPPTRFSDEFGQAVVPGLVDAPEICIDGTPPSLVCPPDVRVQCSAQVPVAATNDAEFIAQGGSASDDGCRDTVAVEHVGDIGNGGAGCPADPLLITRRYRATDCAGNESECTQVITVVDDTPPLVTCPADILQNADASACSALVTWPVATANDACAGDVSTSVLYDIDLDQDGVIDVPNYASTTYAFPVGMHKVIARATDPCGNSGTCFFLVTVTDVSDLVVNVQLQPVFATGAVTRCITFELWPCPATEPLVVINQELTFIDGLAASALIAVPCGNYACITARDTLHTLRRTVPLQVAATQFTADFTGDPAAGGHWLVGGNLNDDRTIDMLDFGVFVYQYVSNATPGANTMCTLPGPHADLNGDGVVSTADFTFIQINFMQERDADCCARAEDDGQRPVARISVTELLARGLGHLAVADLNGDGWLDAQDIVAFMHGASELRTTDTRSADRACGAHKREH